MSQLVTPEQFFGDTPPARLIGSECEYKLQRFHPLNGHVEYHDLNEYMNRSVKLLRRMGIVDVGEFWSNGSRMYIDAGEHIEYATPECYGPRQAAEADIAGMHIMRALFDDKTMPLHSGLFRNSGSSSDPRSTTSTRGYHENYLIPRGIAHEESALNIIPSYLASRVWGMAGHVNGVGYSLSQKIKGVGGAPFELLKTRMSSEGNKPMAVVPRIEQETDVFSDNRWARLEVRLGDPGFSPAMRYLGFAATSLVLRIVEHADMFDDSWLNYLQFDDPLEAAQDFSKDISLQATAVNRVGHRLTAIDSTEAFMDAATWLSARIDIPDDERLALGLWQRSITALRSMDLPNLEYGSSLEYFDFAARHRLLSHRHPNELLVNRNPAVIYDHLRWDRLSPQGSAQLWWQHKPQDWLDPTSIEFLQHDAPQETRAGTRAELIKSKKIGDKKLIKVNWAFATNEDHVGEPIGDMYR